MVKTTISSPGDPKSEFGFESDRALAIRVAVGDMSAQRELVDHLLDGIRTTVFCLAGSDRDADDFVQLSVLEVLASAGTYRADSSLQAWATKITVRTTMRQLKKRSWRAQFVVLEPSAEEMGKIPVLFEDAEEALSTRRLQSSLLHAMAELKPNYRVSLMLRLAQGYSVAEIAEITDTTFNTVRERLRVGRKKLHRLIQKDPRLQEWVEANGKEGSR